jgi:predicted Zn finger-like uncharacterized protein
MEIVCEACHAKLSIPDEKLPPGHRISVKCPRCGNKLLIDAPPMKTEGSYPLDQGSETFESPGQGMPASIEAEGYDEPLSEEMAGLDDTEADSTLDSYGEGERLALVMVADTHPIEKVKEALEELGYNPIRARNTQEAIFKVRFQNFDLIILSDLFDKTPLQQSPILQYLNHLSMSVRRKMFVLLMSDTFRTMDHMTAFAMSANLVANWKDLERLSNILGRALADNEKFYKVFMDTVRETGKA